MISSPQYIEVIMLVDVTLPHQQVKHFFFRKVEKYDLTVDAAGNCYLAHCELISYKQSLNNTLKMRKHHCFDRNVW